MQIIDAQIHPVAPAMPWSESFTPEQAAEAGTQLALAAMNAVGVDAALVNWTFADVQSYVTRVPDRFGGVPFAGPLVPMEGTADEFVADVARTPGMVGVRTALAHPIDRGRIEHFRSGGFTPFFEAAARHDVPVFVLAHGHLPELHETLATYDSVRFVIDHVGLYSPPANPLTPALFDDVPHVLALAEFPNVAVKFTGVPSLSAEPYPFADVWPFAHKLLDAFGVDRLMWGSDFTRCAPLHTYREAVDFLRLTNEVSESDKEALFSATLRRWVGWPA
ncbi:MAG: amidohydrolase [Actinobacteria bacterium]|nr:amidohydrolase [Actinomycetota bacterium]